MSPPNATEASAVVDKTAKASGSQRVRKLATSDNTSSGSALERLIPLFSGVRQNGAGWTALCPAHPDRNPSLSLSQGDKGALVKCFAGCETHAVLAAVGRTMADLFDRPRQQDRPVAPSTYYLYTDAEKQPLFRVVRKPGKALGERVFYQQHPDGHGGWAKGRNGAPRVLYRLPEICQAVKDGTTIFIAEGEKDVDALVRAGEVATCNPEGASKWRDEFTDTLAGAARVVLVADRDAAGHKHAQEVAQSLAGRVGRLDIVQEKSGKDSADHLAAGRGPEEFDLITDEIDDLVGGDVAKAKGADEAQNGHLGSDPQGDENGASASRSRKEPSAAEILVDIALSTFRFGCTPDAEPFAVRRAAAPVVMPLRGGRTSLRAALSAAYHDETGKPAPQGALADTMLTLEGLAVREAPEVLSMRVARDDDGTIWLDLGDLTGLAVKVTADDWGVAEPPMLFSRTALTAALPMPERGGSLFDLWRLLNVDTASRPLLLAWLVAALIPNLPHPILALTGEQGTGKSTAATAVTALIDPSPAQLRKPPKDDEAWVTAAAGSWVVGVDNVSHIDPGWSDSLCRAVTGDGDVRRKLYSDGQLAVWAFRRCVCLTGIDLGSLPGDLADRLLLLDLRRIEPWDRLLDADLAERWRKAHPRLLGGLLDLAVAVLSALPTIRLATMPRMADFACILTAVDQVLGTDGYRTYAGMAERLAASAVEGDAALREISRCLVREWTGTAAELLTRLGDHPEAGRSWPSNGQKMTAKLKRGAQTLRAQGWTVEEDGTDHRGTRRWRIAPPDRAESRAESQSDPAESAESAAAQDPLSADQKGAMTWGDAESAESAESCPISLCHEEEEEGGVEDQEGESREVGDSFGTFGAADLDRLLAAFPGAGVAS